MKITLKDFYNFSLSSMTTLQSQVLKIHTNPLFPQAKPQPSPPPKIRIPSPKTTSINNQNQNQNEYVSEIQTRMCLLGTGMCIIGSVIIGLVIWVIFMISS